MRQKRKKDQLLIEEQIKRGKEWWGCVVKLLGGSI